MVGESIPVVGDAALLDAVCRRLGLRRLVLFGSHATGKPPLGRDSDVDLAISVQAGSPRLTIWQYHDELAEVFPDQSLDLVFLADADPLFRWEIMRDGRLLWGDPLDYVEYRAFAFRDFIDSADLRALETRLFEKKMVYVRERLDAAS